MSINQKQIGVLVWNKMKIAEALYFRETHPYSHSNSENTGGYVTLNVPFRLYDAETPALTSKVVAAIRKAVVNKLKYLGWPHTGYSIAVDIVSNNEARFSLHTLHDDAVKFYKEKKDELPD